MYSWSNSVCLLIFIIRDCYSILPEVVDWTSVGGDQEPSLYSEQWANEIGFHREECPANSTICRNVIDSCGQPNRSTVCLNKCCAEGYKFSQPLLKCIKSNHSFNPQRVLPVESRDSVNVSDFVIRRTSWNCSEKSTYLWSSKSQHRSSLSVIAGKLYIPQVWIRDAQWIESYCIDDFLSSDGSHRIKALVCGESHQYWFIALMMTFMPWLFLFSASFMLLTLTTYCAIPTLRRTMHGFTLCCHLISMTTHFIGLATIYSNIISLTRFTCLFFGAGVHFFNISSFTWITVMGFDTWKKIKSTQSDLNRRGRSQTTYDVKKKICYSIYGWGLPLAVVAASRLWEGYSFWNSNRGGDIQETMAYYGQRIRLCWYSYDYIKEIVFVNGPLVVLLVGNMFFFIPSAVSVYRSSKFAAKSASSNNKLENQRLIAVFKLFVLMEFHALPCLLRLLSITTGVQVAIYIHVFEIIFHSSSGLFLFVNFAWKPHIFPLLRSQFNNNRPTKFYLGRKYLFNSAQTSNDDTNTTTSLSIIPLSQS